ncbi:hypothetical protein GHT06_011946 [Daphnia sinensis]|uniref:Uncharacterized protein n=1 Tax=Daphnia sinensis TaxID=1820382 RepID=A0AAD5LFG0_9CRUS|nr:hypothetical protein GHT06_011946 [Daphnia sinensis]
MLCIAAARENVKRLTSLMEAGADLNQPDVSNRTALHLAAHHNQESCVIFLLKNRALPDKKDDFGLTPADVARKFEHGNILKMLSVSEGNSV